MNVSRLLDLDDVVLDAAPRDQLIAAIEPWRGRLGRAGFSGLSSCDSSVGGQLVGKYRARPPQGVEQWIEEAGAAGRCASRAYAPVGAHVQPIRAARHRAGGDGVRRLAAGPPRACPPRPPERTRHPKPSQSGDLNPSRFRTRTSTTSWVAVSTVPPHGFGQKPGRDRRT